MNWRAGAEPPGSGHLSDDPWPVARKDLLTEREQSLYLSLLSLYPNHKLFVQVALSQLIDVDPNHPERESIRARYKQLVADFVLCRENLCVVAVIELDDRTHQWPKRQGADARKNKVLADAGIRLVRIPAGRLPSADLLQRLIDVDGMGEKIYPEETVLTLAEDIYARASSHDSDGAGAVSREFKRFALKMAALVGLVACGWLFYSYLFPTLMQRGFAPLAKPTHSAVVPPKARVVSKPIASASPIKPPVAEVPSEARKARQLEIAASGNQKNLAFAAFYSPPASCEHPADWSAQVECGNQYMRAKKVFEQKWTGEHANQGSPAGVVSDNSSVGGPRK